MKSLSLYELNSLVRRTIDLTMYDEYWIRAEISSVQDRGHCFMEFVQKDERSDNIIAKARAQVWASKWTMIRSHFETATGQHLQAGMQVLVQVRVTFHELYGFSLNVVDIDPTLTLGDIARKRMEIIRQLQDEGVDQMNKELLLPRLLQRIAIISSPTAAGYGDFCNQLEKNDSGLAFHTQLFPAIMQGEGVEQSVIKALNDIAVHHDLWDVVVIIRGGGAISDLSGFDTLELAENVAQFPIPIITGIGHERDDTVIDMVSHTRVKTPTAAAEFIIHHQEAELMLIDQMADRLHRTVGNMLMMEEQRLKLITNKLPSLFSAMKAREEGRLDRAFAYIQNMIVQQTSKEMMRIDMLDQHLSTSIYNLVNNQKHRLEVCEAKLDAVDPQRILNLGFSITRVNDKAVSKASELHSGDVIKTTFAQGTVESVVKY